MTRLTLRPTQSLVHKFTFIHGFTCLKKIDFDFLRDSLGSYPASSSKIIPREITWEFFFLPAHRPQLSFSTQSLSFYNFDQPHSHPPSCVFIFLELPWAALWKLQKECRTIPCVDVMDQAELYFVLFGRYSQHYKNCFCKQIFSLQKSLSPTIQEDNCQHIMLQWLRQNT